MRDVYMQAIPQRLRGAPGLITARSGWSSNYQRRADTLINLYDPASKRYDNSAIVTLLERLSSATMPWTKL